MKNYFLIASIYFLATSSFGQSMKDVGGTKLYLVTDVKGISSTNNNSNSNVSTTGVGKLGVTFKSGNFYGDILFNVTNRNKELSELDSVETNIFTNNLLIPDNSGQGISNFHISLGLRSFYKYNQNLSDKKMVHLSRVGAYGYWQANNTTWTKDSISTAVYISSFGIYATYNILSLELIGSVEDKVYLSCFAGFENRILGGDYSLEKNKELRNQYLGTDQLKFRSFPSTGFILELGKFYGKITETYFGNGDINGFSGWQATVSLGLVVDINIAAKNIGSKK